LREKLGAAMDGSLECMTAFEDISPVKVGSVKLKMDSPSNSQLGTATADQLQEYRRETKQ